MIRYRIYTWTPPRLTPEQEAALGRQIALEGRERFLEKHHPYLGEDEQAQLVAAKTWTIGQKVILGFVGVMFFGLAALTGGLLLLVALITCSPILALSMGSLLVSRNRYRKWVDEMLGKYAASQARDSPKHPLPTMFSAAEKTVACLKAFDRWTLIKHEAGLWLEDLIRDAKHEKAPQRLRDTAFAVRHYLGLGDDAPLTREHIARFASRYEEYAAIKIAPSKGMVTVFRDFTEWLVTVYITANEAGWAISPEARKWFEQSVLTLRSETIVIAADRRN